MIRVKVATDVLDVKRTGASGDRHAREVFTGGVFVQRTGTMRYGKLAKGTSRSLA